MIAVAKGKPFYSLNVFVIPKPADMVHHFKCPRLIVYPENLKAIAGTDV
jgi:hypothetical protein